jgi:succinoglycan biosynthesis protein ExoM
MNERASLNQEAILRSAPIRLAVGVCTYKRPELLEGALVAIAIALRESGEPARVLVVDNDGSDPTVRTVVERVIFVGGSRAEYHVEKRPGIAAARERVFSLADEGGADLLAMVDDDERPSPQWLVELLATRATSGAVVVGGPVRPLFPAGAQSLQRHARFWSVEMQRIAGRVLIYAAGNFLIDLRAIEQVPRPLFDDRFGLTGGEDVVFFERLRQAGLGMEWSELALVQEMVPPQRATIAWIRKRRFGLGCNAVRWESLQSRPRAALKTLGLSARLVIYPLLRREPETPLLGWLLEAHKVGGRISAHLGYGYAQYG